ncbi:hypothetical protein FZEAL_6776 [Fusarium zealandicum]|uniref:CHAT domain-containing protein n=1 Tax=Fusarium zealandicum TaxID=1053134 RepID=A0A8H4XJJ3_9HYPO|nr:hypothetical protein FZEAL_6776 [Fusarium zealandicum]
MVAAQNDIPKCAIECFQDVVTEHPPMACNEPNMAVGFGTGVCEELGYPIKVDELTSPPATKEATIDRTKPTALATETSDDAAATTSATTEPNMANSASVPSLVAAAGVAIAILRLLQVMVGSRDPPKIGLFKVPRTKTNAQVMNSLAEAAELFDEVVDPSLADHPDEKVRADALEDLEDALEFAQGLVSALQEDDTQLPVWLNNVGVGLGTRYLFTGSMSDIDEAIAQLRRAATLAPDASSMKASVLSNLGNRLDQRHLVTGNRADVEEAVRVKQEAVDLTPAGDPDLIARQNNLGVQLIERHIRTGALIDIERAVQIAREVVDAPTTDPADFAGRLGNLANALQYRYRRNESLADLDECIEVMRQCIEAVPEGHPDLAGWLDSLGNSLGQRYASTGQIQDLEEAIQLIQTAVELTPEKSLDLPSRLNNLGTGLVSKSQYTGAITDLDEAIRVLQLAVDSTPEDDSLMAGLLNNLGGRYFDRYRSTEPGDLEARDKAIAYLQSALHRSSSPIVNRIEATQGLLRSCAYTSDWEKGFEASQTAMELIPKLIARPLDNADKQYMLSQVVGFASDSAAAALHANRSAMVALGFLEQGRGVLAASLDEMRADLSGLQEQHPVQADKFHALRAELEEPVENSKLGRDGHHQLSSSSRLAQSNRRLDAGDELDGLIEEIRKLPGFDRFLCPPGEVELRAAARNGPIAIINVSNFRCDAILVDQHQVRALSLPKLSKKEIEKQAAERSQGTPAVLEWLWDSVASPVLNALGLTQPPSDGTWPRMWWIPTGPLSKFPLHAAGYHTKRSSESVLDRVMSSYSSSVKAIIQGRSRSQVANSGQALLVAMKSTPQSSSLPFAEKEISQLHTLCRSMQIDPLEPERYKRDIISHLRNCQVFHFAGHGYTDRENPSRSHLRLEDWKDDPLEVSDLLEINLRQQPPFLAYLSACGTGRIEDQKYFDESIHLISACQLAGFRHVIGTLWGVSDELCLDMARITYEGIRDGGMTDESVCRGLHAASRVLRDSWLKARLQVRRESKSTQKIGKIAASENEGFAPGTSRGDREDGALPRDIVSCDDSDDDGMESLHWVPYVHFGV